MTWSEFITVVKQMAFPDREASNLVYNHTRYILDGIVELQKRIPQLRQRNFNLISFPNTFYRCKATVLPKPDGVIVRLFTYTQDDHCDAVYYHPTTREHMESILRKAQNCVSATEVPDIPQVGLPPEDYYPAAEVTDKGYRASSGYYAVIGGQIFVWPHIESTEHINIEWQGVKLTYSPNDEVLFPQDVQSVVELYVQAQAALREDCDKNQFAALQASWNAQAAQLAWWYRTKELLPESPWREEDNCPCGIITVNSTVNPPSSTFVVYLGNAGTELRDSYTEAEITGVENLAGNNTTRSVLSGDYEIERPASNTNEYRLISFPESAHAGAVEFRNSGFPLPMAELTATSIAGTLYRVFRTTVPSSGSMTSALGNPITIVPK